MHPWATFLVCVGQCTPRLPACLSEVGAPLGLHVVSLNMGILVSHLVIPPKLGPQSSVLQTEKTEGGWVHLPASWGENGVALA